MSHGIGFYGSYLSGGDGDDIVYGGVELDDSVDKEAELGDGDDVYFGGEGGSDIEVDGDAGNDKIFGPSNAQYVTLNG